MVSEIYEMKRSAHQDTDTSVSATPHDYEEQVANFHRFVQTKTAENSIGPDNIINMDEVRLTFDLPLTRTEQER